METLGHFDSLEASNIPVVGHEQAKVITALAPAIRDDGAAEHVLLSPHDLPDLRGRGQPNSESLHDEARYWTNRFAGVQGTGVQADLTVQWHS